MAKYYLIAGEASGDLHGANLMRELSHLDASAEFRVWGGDRMQAAGGDLVKHYRDLAFMGFIEVVMNLRIILKNLLHCKNDILDYKPDVLVLIDYPGFNMRIAEFSKKNNIKTVWYIAPQVWAWKENRVKKLKRDVDEMLCILPFEKAFFAKHRMEVKFVGHPLLDAIAKRKEFDKKERIKELGLDEEKPVISLLPGSRKQEIKTMLPIMKKAAENYSDYQIAVAGAPSQDENFYREIIDFKKVGFIENRTYDLLEISDAAMVTSGTATLETALFDVPQVVCYKGNWLSYSIAKRLVKVDFIALVNLIMGKEIVTELIQNKLNPKNLKKELEMCLIQSKKFKKNYALLKKILGGEGASKKAAYHIHKIIEN